MEERLRALDLSRIPPNLEQDPTLKADSLVHLLLQGLQSKDNNMINVSINVYILFIIYYMYYDNYTLFAKNEC